MIINLEYYKNMFATKVILVFNILSYQLKFLMPDEIYTVIVTFANIISFCLIQEIIHFKL